LLSDRWCGSKERDGSYFIDQDGDDFACVLKYLRTGVLPIFYDRVKGHDYQKYLTVCAQARYFQIARLEEWVEKKQYIYSVKVSTSVRELDSSMDLSTHHSSNEQIRVFPHRTLKKQYICPRGIWQHMGSTTVRGMECGAQCRRQMGEDGPESEVEVWKYVTVGTTHHVPEAATA
jgi:BTB/POZ domain-containing protein KCTD9